LLCRVTTWTVTVAMLLPTVVACTAPTPYADAGTARLDGIVVDGTRRAGEREPAWRSSFAPACAKRRMRE
jgi:hypothetical protein